ncbi:MAG: SagB/ThcOx family dehydrogenase [Acetobacteraceae bacterium]
MRMAVRNLAEANELRADDERYHVATRNPANAKRFIKAHETHYAPWVQRLVEEAPLHLDRGQRLPLPKPDGRLLGMPVGRALVQRKSGRVYGDRPVSAVVLSTLLAAALGVRQRSEGGGGGGMIRRNVTNSGNLGSVEAYPIALRVAGVPPGIYHFDSVHHDLVALHRGQFQTWLRECVLFQREFAEAAVAVVLTSAFGRLKAKYGPRGYKLGLFDIGHVSENLYLVATALGLEVCATAGFVDETLDRALGLDGLDTATSLVVLIGNPRVPDPSTR